MTSVDNYKIHFEPEPWDATDMMAPGWEIKCRECNRPFKTRGGLSSHFADKHKPELEN